MKQQKDIRIIRLKKFTLRYLEFYKNLSIFFKHCALIYI